MIEINGKEIGPTAFGLMRMTFTSTPLTDEELFPVLKKALEVGSNFWNSGEFYAGTKNLELLNRYFTKYPEDADKVVLSVKGAFDIANRKPDCSKEGIKKSIDNILRLLDGKKSLDIFECARVDANVRIEDTISYIAEYVKAGKVGGICLSECSADTIRRAAKVHKIAGVEVEYSLFCTEIRDNGVLKACKELEIPVIAYAPVGAGFLSGEIKSPEDLPETDNRRHFDRFQPENFQSNIELVQEIQKIADSRGVTNAQVAIQWLRQLSGKEATIIPLPGTTKVERVVENCKEFELSDADMNTIEGILKNFTPKGGRYSSAHANYLHGDSKA